MISSRVYNQSGVIDSFHVVDEHILCICRIDDDAKTDGVVSISLREALSNISKQSDIEHTPVIQLKPGKAVHILQPLTLPVNYGEGISIQSHCLSVCSPHWRGTQERAIYVATDCFDQWSQLRFRVGQEYVYSAEAALEGGYVLSGSQLSLRRSGTPVMRPSVPQLSAAHIGHAGRGVGAGFYDTQHPKQRERAFNMHHLLDGYFDTPPLGTRLDFRSGKSYVERYSGAVVNTEEGPEATVVVSYYD